MWGATAGRHLSTGHAASGTVVRSPKSLTNRDSWRLDREVCRRELTRPFSPALLLNLYRWDFKPNRSSTPSCSVELAMQRQRHGRRQNQRQRQKQRQRQRRVSNAVHPRAGLTGLAGGPGSPADAPWGKPSHDDASPAGQTLDIQMKKSLETLSKNHRINLSI